MTLGEFKIGIKFNPSNDSMVDQIKQKAAELIDLIDSIPSPSMASSEEATKIGQEVGRLRALAMTEIESAAMWAVKAATKGK